MLDLPVKDLCVRGLALQKLWITSSKTGNLIQGYIFWQFPRGLKKGREKWRKKRKKGNKGEKEKGEKENREEGKKDKCKSIKGKII